MMNKYTKAFWDIINWKHFFGVMALLFAIEITLFYILGLASPILVTIISLSIVMNLISWGMVVFAEKLKEKYYKLVDKSNK